MTNTATDNKKSKRDNTLVNYNIRCGKVRLIGDGTVAVMRREEAQQMAEERGLDLV